MSLNVNYNLLYSNGIDRSMLKEVSNEILRRAAQKNPEYTNSVTTNQVNSNAKPLEIGIDLYQGRINADMQRRIAMNNTLQFQFNQEALNSINFLNAQAAVKKVDGKYMPAVNEVVTETQKTAETNISATVTSIVSASTAKDKEGSNPFYHGELLFVNSENSENNEQDTLKSIFI